MNMASSPILMLIIIFSMWLLISYSESTQYIVGGDSENSWKVPFPSRHALTHWASSHQFIDTILFDGDDKVNEDEYTKWNVAKSHSKMGLKLDDDDDVVVKNKPLVIPPLITLPEPPSPAPAPGWSDFSGSNGGAAAGLGLIMWLGVSSLAMIMFLI